MAVRFWDKAFVFLDSLGEPRAGGKVSSYDSGTSSPRATFSDDDLGTANAVELTLNGSGRLTVDVFGAAVDYKFIVTNDDGTDSITIDPAHGGLDGDIVSFLQAGTGAVSRTVRDRLRETIHISDFGTVGIGNDDTSEIALAITQAGAVRGELLFPATLSGYGISSPLAISSPVTLRGLGQGHGTDLGALSAQFIVTGDIAALEITNGFSGGTIRNLAFRGPGYATSTKTGIKFTNVPYAGIIDCSVEQFDRGVYYTGTSCFSSWIKDSQIRKNKTVNIQGDSNTNALVLDNVEFGSGYSATGVKIVDSSDAKIIACNAEGVTFCAIDLDNTSDLHAGHLISGFHCEANTSSVGDIRIGFTAKVHGVTIIGGLFNSGAGADCAINAIRGSCTVIGVAMQSGYSGSGLEVIGFARVESTFDEFIYSVHGTANLKSGHLINHRSGSALAYSAPTVFDAAYKDATGYNLYNINSGDITAAKNYYGGFSVARVEATGAPGAGHKIYALGGLISNSYGGGANVRALLAGGALDQTEVTVTYGTTMTINAAQGNLFVITITDGVAHTIETPVNPVQGQAITFRLRNTSGGAAGVCTWSAAAFKMAAWAQAATANSRSITFAYNGTNWIEVSRTAADVPN